MVDGRYFENLKIAISPQWFKSGLEEVRL